MSGQVCVNDVTYNSVITHNGTKNCIQQHKYLFSEPQYHSLHCSSICWWFISCFKSVYSNSGVHIYRWKVSLVILSILFTLWNVNMYERTEREESHAKIHNMLYGLNGVSSEYMNIRFMFPQKSWNLKRKGISISKLYPTNKNSNLQHLSRCY